MHCPCLCAACIFQLSIDITLCHLKPERLADWFSSDESMDSYSSNPGRRCTVVLRNCSPRNWNSVIMYSAWCQSNLPWSLYGHQTHRVDKRWWGIWKVQTPWLGAQPVLSYNAFFVFKKKLHPLHPVVTWQWVWQYQQYTVYFVLACSNCYISYGLHRINVKTQDCTSLWLCHSIK